MAEDKSVEQSPEASAATPSSESTVIRGSGAFEKRADVFPVAPAETAPVNQILNSDGPLMSALPESASQPTTPVAEPVSDGDGGQ